MNIMTAKQAVQNHGVNMLIYGESGAGKTSLALTTGTEEGTLVISPERGLLPLRHTNIHVVMIESVADLIEVYDYLNTGDHEYKWIIVDSLSEVAEVVLAHEMKSNRDGRKAYGELANTIVQLVKDFRDLPYHVVMLAKQAWKDTSDAPMFRPMMPGQQLLQKLPYEFDEVLCLRRQVNEQNEVTRGLMTDGDGHYVAKDRAGVLNRWERPNLAELVVKITTGEDSQDPPQKRVSQHPTKVEHDGHESALDLTKELIQEVHGAVNDTGAADLFLEGLCTKWKVERLELAPLELLRKTLDAFAATAPEKRSSIIMAAKPQGDIEGMGKPLRKVGAEEQQEREQAAWQRANKRYRALVSGAGVSKEIMAAFEDHVEQTHNVTSFKDVAYDDLQAVGDQLARQSDEIGDAQQWSPRAHYIFELLGLAPGEQPKAA